MSHSPWLIVGLGNPGPRYAATRHNFGARVVNALRQELGQPAFRAQKALHARTSRGSHVLAIPTTFMNDSGQAVHALVRKFRVPKEKLLIIHDDKDLAFGKLKLQFGRGPAGHRGVRSVVETIGAKELWRLRIGIGAPALGMTIDRHVLERFTDDEDDQIARAIAPDAIAMVKRVIGGERIC